MNIVVDATYLVYVCKDTAQVFAEGHKRLGSIENPSHFFIGYANETRCTQESSVYEIVSVDLRPSDLMPHRDLTRGTFVRLAVDAGCLI